MATPQEKLAASLARLEELQRDGRRVFRSRELTRTHRERLVRQGFLSEVMRGWLISSSPGSDPGDSTPWYASFWEFCSLYCQDRFGDRWYLSPEQSLLLHGESSAIPRQVIVHTPTGSNNTIDLPFGTSLYDLKQPHTPPAEDLTTWNSLPVYTPAAALVKVPPAFFRRHPLEARLVLAEVGEPSELLARLLDGGHSRVAGRLAGAFRRLGREETADEIVRAMRSAGYDVRREDPFESDRSLHPASPASAPVARRLRVMWGEFRDAVIEVFPEQPGLPDNTEAYLRSVDEIYESDAYHSLSIEGYQVTPELVERVRAGDWDPANEGADRDASNALAARGYWEAFQLVKDGVAAILGGTDAADIIRTAHRDWYRAMFQPCVRAGLIPASALAGYRIHPTFLRGSRHVPPRSEAVADAMSTYLDLFAAEPEASVRAVLGHWMFGYIHPYPDGNGRLARFLMNAALASGGYPWTVMRVKDRGEYLSALESASVDLAPRPFADFIAERVRWSLDRVD
jgi:hypothetical protein